MPVPEPSKEALPQAKNLLFGAGTSDRGTVLSPSAAATPRSGAWTSTREGSRMPPRPGSNPLQRRCHGKCSHPHGLPPVAAGEGESTCCGVFSEFMIKVAQFEEQAEAGKRLLMRFHQELEYFRRPPITKGSDVMSEILKSNCTGRMKSYMEAGCSLQCRNISNINQLKALLRELECLVKDAHGITLTATLSALEVSESSSTDNELNIESCSIEDEEKQEQLDNDVSFTTLMIIVHNMLKLDYTMQEKTVNALSLKTPLSELEGYCLMWDLRPYIDDNVMQLAWKICP